MKKMIILTACALMAHQAAFSMFNGRVGLPVESASRDYSVAMRACAGMNQADAATTMELAEIRYRLAAANILPERPAPNVSWQGLWDAIRTDCCAHGDDEVERVLGACCHKCCYMCFDKCCTAPCMLCCEIAAGECYECAKPCVNGGCGDTCERFGAGLQKLALDIAKDRISYKNK